jgi:hypothetical protein
MAESPDKRPPSTQADPMKQCNNLFAHVSSYRNEGEAIVFSCDMEGLRYLWNLFGQRLSDDTFDSFEVGADSAMPSDGKCYLTIVKVQSSNQTQILQKSQTHFEWFVSSELAGKYRDRLADMLMASTPCHQYLDVDDISSPIVIVTFCEYPIDVLRAMRDRT